METTVRISFSRVFCEALTLCRLQLYDAVLLVGKIVLAGIILTNTNVVCLPTQVVYKNDMPIPYEDPPHDAL